MYLSVIVFRWPWQACSEASPLLLPHYTAPFVSLWVPPDPALFASHWSRPEALIKPLRSLAVPTWNKLVNILLDFENHLLRWSFGVFFSSRSSSILSWGSFCTGFMLSEYQSKFDPKLLLVSCTVESQSLTRMIWMKTFRKFLKSWFDSASSLKFFWSSAKLLT